MANRLDCEDFEIHSEKVERHRAASIKRLRSRVGPPLLFISASLLLFANESLAQVSYTARFTLDKQKFHPGEPIFCTFIIQNTGARTFVFRYRTPDRVLNRELENEPHFRVTLEHPRPVPDPAPRPCGGAKGSVLYGSVTLPPGRIHTERWLLNQWARIGRTGRYHVRAERRLPLLTGDPAAPESTAHPAAFALAINDLSFEVTPGSESELRAVFHPYIKMVTEPIAADPAEAVVVLVTLPQSFFLDRLVMLAHAPADERRWDRDEALEGLARLGTPAAWAAIVKIARGNSASGSPPQNVTPTTIASAADDALRAHAILLLGERGHAASLPAVIEIAKTASDDLRGDALRALGFFHQPSANTVLIEELHSSNTTERVNAILGLKNLGGKDSIPALLAMLRDGDPEVRQVANFALQGLTGEKFKLSPSAGGAESERAAEQWHNWWKEHAVSFLPKHPLACHDW
jgi:hypothetical protein